MIKSLPSFGNKGGRTSSFIEHVKSQKGEMDSRSNVSTAPEEKLQLKKRGYSEQGHSLPPVDESTPLMRGSKKGAKYLEMAEKGMQKRKELAEKARLK